MLLRFRFSNFRSFRDEQELSLIASTQKAPQDGVLHPSGIQEAVLPVVAMYGANASGKTNVLRAFQFMATMVRESHARWEPEAPIPRQPFGTQEGVSAPSIFVADLFLNSVRYQYGFSVNSEVVLEEWLFAYPCGKKQTWFNRKQGAPISFDSSTSGDNKTIERLTRKNSLFLSAAAQNNDERLSPVYRWFSRSVSFVIDDRSQRRWLVDSIRRHKKELTRLLSFADLGITDLRITKKDAITGNDAAFEPTAQNTLSAMMNSGRLREQERVHLVHRLGDSEIALPQDQESNGTLAYLSLLGRIVPLRGQGGLVCVDELDSSLHPHMATQLIRLFVEASNTDHAAQLVFSTHNTNLLSADILRRDEIWFTEKRPAGNSQLYPLTDFIPRKDENLERGYLQGRYGAIPFLNPDCLAPFETEDAETR
jgi:uncharacterized protein